MRKGFSSILVLVGVAAIGALLLSGYEGYKTVSERFGATISTTSITDTIGTFRTNVNSSFENVNTQLVAISSTIAGYGNLVTLNSPLPVANGGTALTTGPSVSSSYLGGTSGTSVPVWKQLVGGAGITLTQSATNTVFSTVGFDATADIDFTGNNTFAGSSTFNGSALFATTTTFRVLPSVPTTTTVSTTHVASVNYVLSKASTFISSGQFTSSTINVGNMLMATSSFTLSYPQRIEVGVNASYSSAGNNNGCQIFVYVDTVSSTLISFFNNPAGTNGAVYPMNGRWLSDELAAGYHNVSLLGNNLGGTACVQSGAGIMQLSTL